MENKKMPTSYKSSELRNIINILRELPEDDRILLGLYLYEDLTQEQVDAILNLRTQNSDRIIYESKVVS